MIDGDYLPHGHGRVLIPIRSPSMGGVLVICCYSPSWDGYTTVVYGPREGNMFVKPNRHSGTHWQKLLHDASLSIVRVDLLAREKKNEGLWHIANRNAVCDSLECNIPQSESTISCSPYMYHKVGRLRLRLYPPRR
jgi:hypothetical protein